MNLGLVLLGEHRQNEPEVKQRQNSTTADFYGKVSAVPLSAMLVWRLGVLRNYFLQVRNQQSGAYKGFLLKHLFSVSQVNYRAPCRSYMRPFIPV